MKTAFVQALTLIASGDRQLGIIVVTTLRMALTSSVIALVLGAPWECCWGAMPAGENASWW